MSRIETDILIYLYNMSMHFHHELPLPENVPAFASTSLRCFAVGYHPAIGLDSTLCLFYDTYHRMYYDLSRSSFYTTTSMEYEVLGIPHALQNVQKTRKIPDRRPVVHSVGQYETFCERQEEE